jgi:hypothetical protein
MTNEEFKTWFRIHRAAFTAIDAWLAKFKTDSDKRAGRVSEDALTQQDILASWFSALRDVDQADAIEATRALQRGSEPAPKMFDDHPREVRRIAGGARADRTQFQSRKMIDGQETFRCAFCQDRGLVSCIDERTMKFASGEVEFVPHEKARKGTEFPIRTTALACSCQGGGRHAGTLSRFDDRKWLRYDGGLAQADMRAKSIEFAESHRTQAAMNLEDWNP